MEGINQITSTIYSKQPENSYRFSGHFQKRWGRYSAGIATRVILSDYSRLINNERINYDGRIFALGLKLRTHFENWPNLTAGVKQTFRNTASEDYKNKYWALKPYAHLKFAFLNGFIFQTDYDFSFTRDRTNHRGQEFQMGKASLYYSAEGSAWGFELQARNIFDVRYRRTHYFNEFMVYDRRTYIQPRTLLFILSYRL